MLKIRSYVEKNGKMEIIYFFPFERSKKQRKVINGRRRDLENFENAPIVCLYCKFSLSS